MAARERGTWPAAAVVLAVVTAAAILGVFAAEAADMVQERLTVGMTIVADAAFTGAVCLDGSPPAYHLHRGSGGGARNWLLQFEGGGWCNDVRSCAERAGTRRGSTRLMTKVEVFSGILSNIQAMNPEVFSSLVTVHAEPSIDDILQPPRGITAPSSWTAALPLLSIPSLPGGRRGGALLPGDARPCLLHPLDSCSGLTHGTSAPAPMHLPLPP